MTTETITITMPSYVTPEDAQHLVANARKRQARLPENSEVAGLVAIDPASEAATEASDADETIALLFRLQDRIGAWDGVLGVGDDDEQLGALAEDARLLARLCDWLVACNRLSLQKIGTAG